MKKNLLLTSVILASFALVGCNTPEPGPEPGPEEVKVTGITTTEADINLVIGEQHALVYTVAPENATNKAVTFSEDSEFIDIVEDKVVGLAAGEAKVTATTVDGGFTVEYNVVVKDAYAAFPKAEVEAFLATKNLEIEIPAYAAASADAYFEIDYDEEYPDELTVYAVNTTTEEFEAYRTVLETAEWYLYNENEYGDFIMCAGEYGERKAVANCVNMVDYVDEGEEPYVALTFTFMDPTTKLELSELSKEFEEYGIEGVVIPDYEGVDLDYEYDEEYYMHTVYTTTSTELAAWLADLVEAGWVDVTKEGDAYSTYKFGETRALLKFIDNTAEYYQFSFVLDVEPLPGFPIDEVNAFLGLYGITDEMVGYDGAEAYMAFNVYASIQVLMQVAEGTDQTVLTTYSEALIVAGFTAGEADQYGRVTYTSENGQFTVMPWLGSLMGETYAGNIYVDVAPVLGVAFPAAGVNAFLTKYGLGFTISEDVAAALAAPEGKTFEAEGGQDDSGYHCYIIYVDGNCLESFKATLGAVLEAAGYVYNSSYDCYLETTDYHQVNIRYNSDDDYTLIAFWE